MLPTLVTYALATGAQSTLIVNAASAVTAGVSFVLALKTLDIQRRIQFTTAADESGNTFTIVGTNQAGNSITDKVTGPNASTTQSNLDFKTLVSIIPLNTTGGTVSIGTNSTGASLWQIVNTHVSPSNIEYGTSLQTGVATWSIQYTYDDPNNLGTLNNPQPFNHPTIVSVGTSTDGATNDPIFAWRLLISAGTGTVRAVGIQAGIAGP